METQYNIAYCYHGKQNCPPGFCWGPGIKEQYKLMFIHEGKGRYSLNGREYELGKGQGFAVYPDMRCCMKADETEPWVYSWIAFEGEDAGELLNLAGLDIDAPVFRCDQPAWFDAYLHEFDAAGNNKLVRGLALKSILYRFFTDWLGGMLENRNPDKSSSAKERYVNQTLEYIAMNYFSHIGISELARMIGIDRVYLSTIFKEKMNISPQAYLLQFRMNKARELLELRNLSVADVSRSIGYSDPLLFSKMFKKVTGLSPTHYRNSLQEPPGGIRKKTECL
ncbi:AraC family transcriptional regulator [Paenibacillus sp. M1]|uniref:AraC family transcriptional regulator n=1 Tax=Paenibacillus haidiansis TaxID=1574488 RepID=A0ABU7VQC0_9BACL